MSQLVDRYYSMHYLTRVAYFRSETRGSERIPKWQRFGFFEPSYSVTLNLYYIFIEGNDDSSVWFRYEFLWLASGLVLT